MKTIDEFKRFYDFTLLKDLEQLDSQRKTVVKKIVMYNLFLTLIFGGILLGLISLNFGEEYEIIFGMLFVIAILVFTLVNVNIKLKYIAEFKDLVIEEIVRFIGPSLSYDSLSYVREDSFINSRLYTSNFTSYNGSEYISGNIDGVNIEFSNLDIVKGRGKHKTKIFDGVFFCADFNKPFQGETFILPDIAENLFGQFGTYFQSLNNSKGELIRFEDTEFEKLFAVYSGNESSARYILNPIMQRLIDFKANTGRKLLISFIDSKVYVALPGYNIKLEPTYFSNIIDFETITQYFINLQLLIGIVEDLHLNIESCLN